MIRNFFTSSFQCESMDCKRRILSVSNQPIHRLLNVRKRKDVVIVSSVSRHDLEDALRSQYIDTRQTWLNKLLLVCHSDLMLTMSIIIDLELFTPRDNFKKSIFVIEKEIKLHPKLTKFYPFIKIWSQKLCSETLCAWKWEGNNRRYNYGTAVNVVSHKIK